MNYVVLLFGGFLLFSGTMILVKPEFIYDLFRRHSESIGFHVLAVVSRLILGVALVAYAAESKHPRVLEVLGWISLTAAIALGVMGRSRFKALVTWVLSFTAPLARMGGSLGILFGGFLLYVVA